MHKCANPECNHHRPSGFLESLWASRGFVFDGKWFCSSACYQKYTQLCDEELAPETESDEAPSVDMTNMRLGEILVAYGIIGSEELSSYLNEHDQSDKRVGQALIESGLIAREAILAALSKQKGTPWVDVFMLSYDDAALALFSKDDARKELALPFGFVDDEVLVATSAAGDEERLAELEKKIGRPIRPLFAPEEDLIVAIEQAYGAERLLGLEKELHPLSPTDRRLGQIMLVEGIITPAQLKQVLKAQQKDASRLGHILLRLGFITEEKLAKSIAKQNGCTWLDLSVSTIPARTIELLSKETAHEFGVIPVKYSNGVLEVATDDPADRAKLRRLEQRINRNIEPVACTTSHLSAALEKYYGKKEELTDHE